MRVLNLNNLLPSTLYPHKVTYIMAMGECMRHAGDDEGVTVDVDDDGIRYERPATLPRKITRGCGGDAPPAISPNTISCM